MVGFVIIKKATLSRWLLHYQKVSFSYCLQGRFGYGKQVAHQSYPVK